MVERYRPLERRSFGPRSGAARRFDEHEDQPQQRERSRERDPEPTLEQARAAAAQQQGGSVKTLPPGQDFGFLRGDDGVERFFHKTGLSGSGVRFDELEEGDRVLFTHIDGPKGPRAIEIRRE